VVVDSHGVKAEVVGSFAEGLGAGREWIEIVQTVFPVRVVRSLRFNDDQGSLLLWRWGGVTIRQGLHTLLVSIPEDIEELKKMRALGCFALCFDPFLDNCREFQKVAKKPEEHSLCSFSWCFCFHVLFSPLIIFENCRPLKNVLKKIRQSVVDFYSWYVPGDADEDSRLGYI